MNDVKIEKEEVVTPKVNPGNLYLIDCEAYILTIGLTDELHHLICLSDGISWNDGMTELAKVSEELNNIGAKLITRKVTIKRRK